jgi:hypothetical protein
VGVRGGTHTSSLVSKKKRRGKASEALAAHHLR